MIYAFAFSLDDDDTVKYSDYSVAPLKVSKRLKLNEQQQQQQHAGRKRKSLTEADKLRLNPNWRAMKKCAKDTHLQQLHGQPLFPALTAYMKLANIMKEFSLPCKRFLAQAEGPGSMAAYLLAQDAGIKGVGITLPSSPGEPWAWLPSLCKHARFSPLTGDLHDEDAIKQIHGLFDFIVADGGMEEVENQELETASLIAREADLAIRLLEPKGNFVLKIYNTVTPASFQLLWRLAHVFQRIIVTHGITVRVNNAERYLVCLNRRKDIRDANAPMTDEFNKFMHLQNTRSANLQLSCQVAIDLHFAVFPETWSEEATEKYLHSL